MVMAGEAGMLSPLRVTLNLPTGAPSPPRVPAPVGASIRHAFSPWATNETHRDDIRDNDAEIPARSVLDRRLDGATERGGALFGARRPRPWWPERFAFGEEQALHGRRDEH